MTNAQLILTVLGIVISIYGASWLNIHQTDKRLDEIGKRFEAHLETIRLEIKSSGDRADDRSGRIEDRLKGVEEDIKEIKTEFKKFYRPIIPG